MSLATAGTDCTASPPLLGAMEDCSIVRGPQLQRLCCQNWRMSGQRCMFGSLRSVVVVHEHRRQDGSNAPALHLAWLTLECMTIWGQLKHPNTLTSHSGQLSLANPLCLGTTSSSRS